MAVPIAISYFAYVQNAATQSFQKDNQEMQRQLKLFEMGWNALGLEKKDKNQLSITILKSLNHEYSSIFANVLLHDPNQPPSVTEQAARTIMESDQPTTVKENAAQRLMSDKRQPSNIRQQAALYQTKRTVAKTSGFTIQIYYAEEDAANKEMATNIRRLLQKKLTDYVIKITPKNREWLAKRGRTGTDIAFSDNSEKKVANAVATLINTSFNNSLKMKLKPVNTRIPNYLSISIVDLNPEPALSGDSTLVLSNVNNSKMPVEWGLGN